MRSVKRNAWATRRRLAHRVRYHRNREHSLSSFFFIFCEYQLTLVCHVRRRAQRDHPCEDVQRQRLQSLRRIRKDPKKYQQDDSRLCKRQRGLAFQEHIKTHTTHATSTTDDFHPHRRIWLTVFFGGRTNISG